MAKKTRAPRRRKPGLTPFERAILTGGPLPTERGNGLFGGDYRIENLDSVGLLPHEQPPISALWSEHHGAPMTDADRASVTARLSEVRANDAASRTRAAPMNPSERIETDDN